MTTTAASQVRFPWHWLLPNERDAITDWVTAHQLDPKRVPVDGLIELDAAAREWRIEVYVVDDLNRKLANPTADRPQTRIVRRTDRGPLPWPTIGGPLAAGAFDRTGADQ